MDKKHLPHIIVAIAIATAALVGFLVGRRPDIVDRATAVTTTFTEQLVTTAHAAGGAV
jgi:hypothetical protein